MITIEQLIERFDNLVTEEHEIGLGEIGDLHDILDSDEDFFIIDASMTRSGNEETINLKE